VTRSLRRAAAIVLTGVLVAALTACGARIDTVLNIADNGSGTRQMTLTLSNSDRDEYVTGGNAALDTSIRKHLPPELTYSGLTQDDENVVAVFTLDFSSVDEYRKKASAILFATGQTDVPEIDIRVEDTLFSKGFSVAENLRSSDLLAWLEPGLLADGVIASSAEGNVTETGATTLKIRGESLDESEPIQHTAMIDLGMESVSMQTRLNDVTSIERVIAYSMPTAAYRTHADEVDSFLANATPGGATLTAGPATAGSTTWTMAITAAPEELAAATSQALGGAEVTFSLVQALGTADPRITLQASGSAQCGTLCSPDADPIGDTLIVPASWAAGSEDLVYEGDQQGDGWHYDLGDTYDVGFERPLGVTAADITTTVDLDGRVAHRVDLHVDGATDQSVGADLEKYLSGRTLLTLDVDRSDADDVVYTLTAGPGESTAITDAFEGAGIGGLWAEVTPTDDDGFLKHDLGVVVGTPFTGEDAALAWGTPQVTHTVQVSGVTLSDGSRSGDTLEVSGPVSSLHGSGWKTTGLVILAAVVLLVAAAAVVLVLQRHRVAAQLGKAKGAWVSGRDKAQTAWASGRDVARARTAATKASVAAAAGSAPPAAVPPLAVSAAPTATAPAAAVPAAAVPWREADLC
jgi:hypothetical protein